MREPTMIPARAPEECSMVGCVNVTSQREARLRTLGRVQVACDDLRDIGTICNYLDGPSACRYVVSRSTGRCMCDGTCR